MGAPDSVGSGLEISGKMKERCKETLKTDHLGVRDDKSASENQVMNDHRCEISNLEGHISLSSSLAKNLLPKETSSVFLFYLKEVFSALLIFDFPGDSDSKEPNCQRRSHKRPGFKPGVGKIPWRKEWLPNPVFLPREFHGQRSLMGYSPCSLKESDTT